MVGIQQSGSGTNTTHFVSQLQWYYARLFPLQSIHNWLSYSQPDSTLFSHREVSFTLSGDIYLRFRSFRNASELHTALKDRAPIKIDFGAIYNIPPVSRSTSHSPLVALEKELVFDIDMTDYIDVMGDLNEGNEMERTDKNWEYMAAAVTILDEALRGDFGFESILWVYSGRRGIHCWVADYRARVLSNESRSAIAEFLAIKFEADSASSKRNTFTVTHPLHPSLSRAKSQVCEQVFNEFVLLKQNILQGEERERKFLQWIQDPVLREKIESALLRSQSKSASVELRSDEKWHVIVKELKANGQLALIDYLILKYTYPRLDIAVSKDIGHLLKSPFCVHPKTGRVCVPFRARDAYEFRPKLNAPELSALIDELNSRLSAKECAQFNEKLDSLSLSELKYPSNELLEKYPGTCQFMQSIAVFQEFLLDLRHENSQLQIQRQDEIAAHEFIKNIN